MFGRTFAVLASSALVLTACSSSEEGATAREVIDHYADGVSVSYNKSLESAKKMDTTIDYFLMNPTEQTLATAKQNWLGARNDYGRTEAFRFYGGPIDNEESGKEGLINAWPLDEAYIDYVVDKPNSGVINNPAQFPTIDQTTITELNEKDGETNISSGWHAIEFLLWGQDLSADGPGNRPLTDYTTGANAERRKTYLRTSSDLLLENLTELTTAWAPNQENYRKTFVALPEEEAIKNMVTGIGELSRGELAGERMGVAYLEYSQEDEHSCFSDNTTNDIIANAEAIRMVVTGEYGGAEGPGFADYVESEDGKIADDMRKQVDTSISDAKEIPAPFDKALAEGVSDQDPSRVAISKTMESLSDQADLIVNGAKAVGVTVNVT